jgi:hypothetical protein
MGMDYTTIMRWGGASGSGGMLGSAGGMLRKKVHLARECTLLWKGRRHLLWTRRGMMLEEYHIIASGWLAQ